MDVSALTVMSVVPTDVDVALPEFSPNWSAADFAAAIRSENKQAQVGWRVGLAHSRNMGVLLREAKNSGAVKHGDWTDWLTQEFAWSERTAQNMIYLAKHWHTLMEALEEKTQPVAFLTVNQALGLIREKIGTQKNPPPTAHDAPQTPQTATADTTADQPDESVQGQRKGDKLQVTRTSLMSVLLTAYQRHLETRSNGELVAEARTVLNTQYEIVDPAGKSPSRRRKKGGGT